MSETDLGLRLMVEYGATGLPREAAERMKALQARVEDMEAEARFLLARIDEWEADGLNDDNARDWMGHVQPSIGRLRALTPPEQDRTDT